MKHLPLDDLGEGSDAIELRTDWADDDDGNGHDDDDGGGSVKVMSDFERVAPIHDPTEEMLHHPGDDAKPTQLPGGQLMRPNDLKIFALSLSKGFHI